MRISIPKESFSYLHNHTELPSTINLEPSNKIILSQSYLFTEFQQKTINSIYDQLKEITINNKGKKDNIIIQSEVIKSTSLPILGHILPYDLVIHPCFSSCFIKSIDNKYACNLYNITLSSINDANHNKETFGFLISSPLFADISFKLLTKDHTSYYNCSIRKVEHFTLTHEEMSLLLSFHLLIIFSINHQKVNIEEILSDYFKRITTLSEEKKYLIVPLIEVQSSIQINWRKINKAIQITKLDHIHGKKILSLDGIYNKLLQSNDKNIYNFLNKAKEVLFYTSYKSHNNFEIVDFLYANDTGETLLNKIARYNNDFKQKILKKYFMDDSSVLEKTTQEIMTTTENSLECIVSFRSLNDKYNIELKKDPLIYVYGKIAMFNNDLIPYKAIDMLYKKSKMTLLSILPMDILYSSFLSTQDYLLLKNLRPVFVSLEQLSASSEVIKFPLSTNVTESNAKYFRWATTTVSASQDYDYETLETLGDSILKVIITIYIYHEDSIKPMNKRASVGQLEMKRASKINNIYLYKKAKEQKMYQYILSRELFVEKWKLPLWDITQQVYAQSISNKVLADFLEATIGACYLFDQNLIDSINFINQMNIYNTKYSDHSNSFLEQKVKGLIPQDTEISYIDIKQDATFIEIMKLSNAILNPQSIESFDQLQTAIGYSFHNKELLKQAFTHTSAVISTEDSYEKLELLGDSIVEIFIILFIFNIYKDLLYNTTKQEDYNENNVCMQKIYSSTQFLNCEYLCRIKSFLCSNSFMCKIAAFYSLNKLLIKGEGSDNKTINSYSSQVNINNLMNHKLNEYNSPQLVNPKVIADSFEALIGAILIDSNLSNCFSVLRKIYGYFILYCCYYMKDIKCSAINDFCLLCSERYKTFPEFISQPTQSSNNTNEAYDCIVNVYIDKQLYCIGQGNTIEAAKITSAEIGLVKLQEEIASK